MSVAPSLVSKVTQTKFSYYLLGKKIYFILNSNAKSGKISKIIQALSKNFPLYSFNILLSSATKTAGELTRDILNQDSLFIIMGGDGTVNTSIQHLIHSPATIGLIPRGTANDLASAHSIPASIPQALKVISEGHVTKIDAIKVNSNYLLTVGSIGFPSTVAEAVNRFKAGGWMPRAIHRYILRSSIYKIFAFGLLILKGKSVAKRSGRISVGGKVLFDGQFVAVFFGKQSRLGKSFEPCPGASPKDESFCLTILKYTSVVRLLLDMRLLSAGKAKQVKNLLVVQAQDFEIECDHFESLLGDGEILDYEDHFFGSRVPQAIQLITPRGK